MMMPRGISVRIIITLLAAPSAKSLLQYQRNNVSMRLNPTSFSNTKYTITEFPRPALRRVPNTPITTFDESFTAQTQEMLGIMYEAKGVGLAAPQIGINEEVFVYNPSDSKNMERVVCNPTITKYSPEVIVEEEGCLSLRSDDTAGQVARSEWIETKYQNELGQQVRRRLKGFEARVFQHEYDHLKGILCYDRFPPEDREKVQESIDTLLGLYKEEDALVDPDLGEAESMQPRPLSARWMPPLDTDVDSGEEDEDSNKRKKQKAGGFGGGGGGGMGKKTSNGKKKDKKKVKARSGARSNDPRFKTTGKTAFANRK